MTTTTHVCQYCNGEIGTECNHDCTCASCGQHGCDGSCNASRRAYLRAEGEMIAGRLFATAAELGAPPVAHGDADLSRIRVTAPATLEEYDRLHAELEAKRAGRKAKRDRIEGVSDLSRLGAL